MRPRVACIDCPSCRRDKPEVHRVLVELAGSVSPIVSAPGHGLVYVGLKGIDDRRAQRSLAQVLGNLRKQGTFARAAIADTLVCARAVAVYGLGTPTPQKRPPTDRALRNADDGEPEVLAGLTTTDPCKDALVDIRTVPRGGDAAVLARAPLGALPLELDERFALVEAGLTNLGQIAALGGHFLEQRFGARGRWFWELASGRDRRQLLAERNAESISATKHLDGPPTNRQHLLAEIDSLLHDVLRQCQRRGVGPRVLDVQVAGIDVSLDIDAPSLSRRRWRQRIEHILGDWCTDRSWPIAPDVTLSVAESGVVPGAQLDVLARDDEDEQSLVEQLRRLCGAESVCRAWVVDEWFPERAHALVPLGETAPPHLDISRWPSQTSRAIVPSCGIRLLTPPVPIRIAGQLASEQTTVDLAPWTRTGDDVIFHIEGPWYVDGAWWEEDGGIDRVYYRIVTRGGFDGRIYRCQRTERWFADAIYD